MAGLYEFSTFEHLSEDLEPSRHPVWWRGQAYHRRPLGSDLEQKYWVLSIPEAVGIIGVPVTRGMDCSYFTLDYKGGYKTGMGVKPEEVPVREARFGEFCARLLEDPWKVWNDYKAEMDEAWRPVVDFVTTKLEKAADHEISLFIDEVYWPASNKTHRIHMFMMYPLTGVYIQFEQLCSHLVGISDKDVSFRKMFQGYDHLAYQMDRELWLLGRRAEELGLKPIFGTAEGKKVLDLLKETESGRKWLEEFHEFLNAHGWRSGEFQDCSTPGWIDDPVPALAHIREFMAKGGAFSLDEIREGQVKEREEIIEGFLQKIPADQKENFLSLLRASQVSQVFSEEHGYYVEQIAAATLYRIFREIGKRFQQAGAIDDWDDVFYLSYDEIRYSIFNYPWKDFHKLVERRKRLWEENNRRVATEPAYVGDPSKAIPDIAMQKIEGRGVPVEAKAGAIVTGIAGAAGIAEGPARVVISTEQFDDVRAGEILVAEITGGVWTPLFARINGVVVEWGGPLSHAAIVARDYGIPAVVSARDATKKIKTGQRIKVDGNEGAVYIIES